MADFDIAATRRFLADKRRKRERLLNKRFEQALRDFNSIIQTITSKYDPDVIYQWGSLLNRGAFSEISDIDIAVAGLKSAESFFSLCHDAEELTDFPLDVVEIERIEPEFKELIIEYGKKVYERRK